MIQLFWGIYQFTERFSFENFMIFYNDSTNVYTKVGVLGVHGVIVRGLVVLELASEQGSVIIQDQHTEGRPVLAKRRNSNFAILNNVM